MLKVILIRVVLVIGLLISFVTMNKLSKVCSLENDEDKKGVIGCGVLCCLILSGILLYYIVTV